MMNDESIWISGWNKNKLGRKDFVMLNLQLPEYKVIAKDKKGDQNSTLRTMMFYFGDRIVYAKETGKEICCYNPQIQKFKCNFRDKEVSIAAICGKNSHILILNHKKPDHIIVLDYSFKQECLISTNRVRVVSFSCIKNVFISLTLLCRLFMCNLK